MTDIPLETIFNFYAPLFAQAAKKAQEPNIAPSARADALIIALDFLKYERRLRLQADAQFDATDAGNAFRARVCELVDAITQAIAEDEVEIEQDYLRRILLTALVELSPRQGEFALESTIDEQLDLIADDDERQSAIYPYALFLSSRLPFLALDSLPSACAKIDRLADELQDAYEYEHVVGKLTAGVADAKARHGQDVSLTDALRDIETLDADELTLETEDGLLRFFNEAALDNLDLLPQERVEKRLNDAFEGLKSAIARIEKTLETGVRLITDAGEIEEEELDEEELDEIRDLLAEFACANPLIAKEGDYLRAFIEKYRAFGSVFSALDLLGKTEPEETRRWLEFAEKNLQKPCAPYEQVEKTIRYARALFLYGDDEEQAKNAVRNALGAIPKLADETQKIDAYRDLVELHLEIGKRKPAKKLLDALNAEIGKIDELLMFEHKKIELLELYLTLRDDDAIDELLEGFEYDQTRLRQALSARVWRAFRDYRENDDAQALQAELNAIVEQALENECKADAVVAANAWRELVAFCAKIA